jgi:ABC-type multidrug transport system fused ATPase/permease subunit
LNLYRAWVSEDAVRGLRRTLEDIEEDATDAGAAGTHAAMAVAEAEPIGGFVGMAISEPLLQIGILVSVVGYMTFLEPWTLALSAAFLIPQALFVPPMQRAINRRAEKRIRVLRRVGGDIVETGAPGDERIERVFQLNMGIYKIKYSMNLLMNFMHYASVAVALGIGGWFAVQHRIDVGTVVAVVSGLGKLKDPWSDLVNWGRELSVDSVKYRLFADAVGRRGLATA